MVRSLPGRSILALPSWGVLEGEVGEKDEETYGNDEVVFLDGFAHGEGETVEESAGVLESAQVDCYRGALLVLQDHDRVGVANGGLQQTLCILGAVRGDDLQSGDASVPGSVVLGVLGGDTGGEAVGATEGDVAGLDTAGHVVRLCAGVNDLVNGLHGEVEGHELALPSPLVPGTLQLPSTGGTHHGVQTCQRSTHTETGEPRLGDGAVDYPPLAEAVEQTLCDLVPVVSSARKSPKPHQGTAQN